MLHETPDPVYGVSLEPPATRQAGYLVDQVNMRSDRLLGLVRRPPMLWQAAHSIGAQFAQHHYYRRNGVVYEIVVSTQNGSLQVFANGVEQVIDNQAGILMGLYLRNNHVDGFRNIRMQTIDDRTYIVNTSQPVELTTMGVPVRPMQVSYVNVTSASNYEDRITVRVAPVTPLVGPQQKFDIGAFEATVTIPSAGSANADYWRGTSKVAQEIADELVIRMQALLDGTDREMGNNTAWDYPYQIQVVGSTVAVFTVSGGTYVPCVVELISDNKNIEVFNETVESVEGIPKYAIEGSVVKVQPDPATSIGTYYVRAVSAVREYGTPQDDSEYPYDHGTAKSGVWTGNEGHTPAVYLQECVWVETGDPAETERINPLQLPLELNMDTLTLTNSTLETDRAIGDTETHPWPKFVGHAINDVAYFQKRLVLLTDGNVDMTRIEKEGQPASFWHKSATVTLVTDPVSIAPSAAGVDALKYIQPHNKSLLITAANMQLKIEGREGVTPQTVSMAPTTKLDVSTDVPPMPLGSDVYFTFPYTTSAGLLEYTGQKDTQQDGADVVTDHVQGYIAGTCKLMTGSPTLRMIVLVTEANRLYVNEYDKSGKYTDRRAWHMWTLPTNHEVINLWFVNDVLHIRTMVGTEMHVQLFEMSTTGPVVYLDNQHKLDGTLTAPDDSLTVTGYPASERTLHPTTDVVISQARTYIPVGGAGELQRRGLFTFSSEFMYEADDPQYDPDVNLILGLPFYSGVRLAGATTYTDDGKPKQVRRTRHKRTLLSLTESGDMSMTISGTNWDTYIARATTIGTTQIGRITNTSRSVTLPYSGIPNVNMVDLFTTDLTPLRINKISWFGDTVGY